MPRQTCTIRASSPTRAPRSFSLRRPPALSQQPPPSSRTPSSAHSRVETRTPVFLCAAGPSPLATLIDRSGLIAHQKTGAGELVVHAMTQREPYYAQRAWVTLVQRLGEGGMAGLLVGAWGVLALDSVLVARVFTGATGGADK